MRRGLLFFFQSFPCKRFFPFYPFREEGQKGEFKINVENIKCIFSRWPNLMAIFLSLSLKLPSCI